jgi:glutathione peroxidase
MFPGQVLFVLREGRKRFHTASEARPVALRLRSLAPKAKLLVLVAALPFMTSAQLRADRAKQPEHAAQSLSDFSLVDGSGKEIPLSTCKGKVVLIVNVASNSMFSDQIAALSKLQDQYKDKGLMVIGVPSNDFGKGEPGTDAEIQKHYRDDLHVTFLVTARSSITGVSELPVFVFLTGGKPGGKPGNEVHWNYTKFIVSRDGKVLARFPPDVAPDDPDFLIAIEKALAGTLKPAAEEKTESHPAAADDDDDGPE